MNWENTITGDKTTEALAEAWASMDGKLDEFRAERSAPSERIATPESALAGYYEGYLCDANELRKRLLDLGYAIIPMNRAK